MRSYRKFTLGLQNALLVVLLALRVVPELRVSFRLKLQLVALVSWVGRSLVENLWYLMGISLCIGRGFGVRVCPLVFSLSLSLSSALSHLLSSLLVACLQEQAPCTCSLDD